MLEVPDLVFFPSFSKYDYCKGNAGVSVQPQVENTYPQNNNVVGNLDALLLCSHYV